MFPSQIASICRHPNLDQFDLSSVRVVLTGGSCISPTLEKQLFIALPNMIINSVVSLFIPSIKQVFGASSKIVTFQNTSVRLHGIWPHLEKPPIENRRDIKVLSFLTRIRLGYDGQVRLD